MTYFFDYATLSMNKMQLRTKSYILPFSKKGNYGIIINERNITLTAITAKIYNALIFNCIKPEIEKVFRKNQNSF